MAVGAKEDIEEGDEQMLYSPNSHNCASTEFGQFSIKLKELS